MAGERRRFFINGRGFFDVAIKRDLRHRDEEEVELGQELWSSRGNYAVWKFVDDLEDKLNENVKKFLIEFVERNIENFKKVIIFNSKFIRETLKTH